MSGTWCAAAPLMPILKPQSAATLSAQPASRINLANGGKLEIAQRMAGHSNAKTKGLYDRRSTVTTSASVKSNVWGFDGCTV
jgi:hypothetical protein